MGTNETIIERKALEKLLSDQGIEVSDEAISIIDSIFRRELNTFINKYHLKKTVSDEYTNGVSALNILSEIQLSQLPSWCKNGIAEARVIGNNQKRIELPDGRRYHLNNKLNHMSGSEWTYFINSIINTNYPTYGEEGYAHKIRKIHPTPKPPQLMRDIIQFFTKENEIVLDYFMGVGGSLLGASLCGRRSVGIDLNLDYVNAYKQASEKLELKPGKCFVGNSIKLLADINFMTELLEHEKASLVLIDPPYSNMMSKEKTGADIAVYGKTATPFSENIDDLGNMSRMDFLEKLKLSVELASVYLKSSGHIVIFIKDLQPSKKQTNLLHAEVINKINELENINYKGLKIWADQSVKLFPYGYPFAFVANQIHQYILVFKMS